MRHVVPIAVCALLAGVVALVFGGHAFVNYDTAYALLWGQDLAAGAKPDLEVALAPTPHPLANLAGMVLEPGGAELLAFLWLAVAGFLVFRLAQEWFGLAAGVVAAALFLTREPVLSFGLRAYVDLPYLALVLAALLVEVRRPRAGLPVLLLLALAGLLRPEAWLFSAAYVLWLRDWRLLPLAAAAPGLWVLHDAILTGDPLWSLTGTRDNAATLGRRTGPVDLVLYGPRRLGEIAREPVLLAAAAGAYLAYRRRLLVGLAALVLALAAFAVLATAGLPIITRYLLLPAALMCALAGGAIVEAVRAVPWADLRRRAWPRVATAFRASPWPAAGVVLVLVLAVLAPGQLHRLDRLERTLGIQEQILADLEALPDAALTCRPIAVPNRRPVPHLALRFDLDPREIEVGRPRAANTYVAPASRAVARRFVFDPKDAEQTLPAVPPSLRRAGGNRSWTIYSYTTLPGGGCTGAT